MSPSNEIDAMAAVENALSQISDPMMRDRVLRWAWDKYSSKPAPSSELLHKDSQGSATDKKVKHVKTSRSSAKTSVTVVKDLNLRPKDKKSFRDFAQEKKPATDREKVVVAIFYLRDVLELDEISANHVFTCFKEANWRTPSNMYRALPTQAHAKGWIDTHDMNRIRVTPAGENLVVHDLPKQPKTTD